MWKGFCIPVLTILACRSCLISSASTLEARVRRFKCRSTEVARLVERTLKIADNCVLRSGIIFLKFQTVQKIQQWQYYQYFTDIFM